MDFGSNIGGVILGGLSENLSLWVGFNNPGDRRRRLLCSLRSPGVPVARLRRSEGTWCRELGVSSIFHFPRATS